MEFDLEGNWLLENIQLSKFDAVFILADESESKVDADSRTVLLLVLIKNLISAVEENTPPIVAAFVNIEAPFAADLLETTYVSITMLSSDSAVPITPSPK